MPTGGSATGRLTVGSVDLPWGGRSMRAILGLCLLLHVCEVSHNKIKRRGGEGRREGRGEEVGSFHIPTELKSHS